MRSKENAPLLNICKVFLPIKYIENSSERVGEVPIDIHRISLYLLSGQTSEDLSDAGMLFRGIWKMMTVK